MNITFIGVGAMGLPMALHLQRAGYQVTGVVVSEAVAANATANGVDTVRGLSEAPGAAMVMVATPAQWATSVGGIAELTSGQVWVIMSTVGP